MACSACMRGRDRIVGLSFLVSARRWRGWPCRAARSGAGKASRKKPEMRKVTSTRGRPSLASGMISKPVTRQLAGSQTRPRADAGPEPGRCRRRRCACWRCPRRRGRGPPGSGRDPGNGGRACPRRICWPRSRRWGSARRGCRANRNCARWAGHRAARGVGAPEGPAGTKRPSRPASRAAISRPPQARRAGRIRSSRSTAMTARAGGARRGGAAGDNERRPGLQALHRVAMRAPRSGIDAVKEGTGGGPARVRPCSAPADRMPKSKSWARAR